jgi:AcrR family transcriptional regulator
VILRRRFHGASLDEIVEEAGYTTGAVYSNVKGKDDLFLAVLVAGWAARWCVEFKLLTREVVRGIDAISRGIGLEALLADEPDSSAQFEEMFLAYAMGPMRAPTGTGTPGEAPMTRSTMSSTTSPATTAAPSAPADTPARIRATLVFELQGAGAVPPPIEVTPVPEIERDPGHGAKLKLVRSLVPRG